MNKVIKYTLNILAIISALIVGFNAIDGITIPYARQIVEGIAVINGVFGGVLTGQKALKTENEDVSTSEILEVEDIEDTEGE